MANAQKESNCQALNPRKVITHLKYLIILPAPYIAMFNSFRLMFPYVGDKLIWDDPSLKRGEYKIRAGRDSKKIRINIFKKSTKK